MKEIITGLRSLLGNEVKDIYQLEADTINVMLFDQKDLDKLYQKTETYIVQLTDANTLALINFVDNEEVVLKSFALVQ
ncbi:hypothetical protein [Pedobacter aquatilis]|uniref:hypothetical protein n=1 Tax=Pedobacter aquatilis TaxID=351343 RepID=UPI00292F191B|nr:hypothetical protein [Pedobacter aquatilis]